MGEVLDRGRRIASYLRGHSGSPRIRFSYHHEETGRGFDMPPGYTLAYMACHHSRDAINAAVDMRDKDTIAGVVYAYGMRDVDDAVVMMPMRSYVRLLRDRLETEAQSAPKKGETE